VRFDNEEISPRDLVAMSIEDAASYLNSAADAVSPKGTLEELHYYQIMAALEDFMDVALGLAEAMDALKGAVKSFDSLAPKIEELRKAGRRIGDEMRSCGILSFDGNKTGVYCAFVVEGVQALLESRCEPGSDRFSFLALEHKRGEPELAGLLKTLDH
jgi:hypothetical protein